ncbi:MAG: hypothetical protein WA632_02045 [Gallionella sp.]
MADRMTRISIAFGLIIYASAAIAENLPDPTRPPEMIIGGAAATTAPSADKHPSGLQSTIISSSRRAAIIDGVTVELWEKHGDEQLVEVNEGSVVLRNTRARRVLTLFPDIRMTKVSTGPFATGESK